MTKILLIEDDKIMRENTAEILELANYEVVSAMNGKAGSFLAKEINPDLIICDIMMPELDGYGVLHILANDPSTSSIPFIFLTAKAEKSEIRKGMEHGADDYLTKPFEDTELLKVIEQRLRKRDSLKKNFSRNLEGLNIFLEQASAQQDLQILTKNKPITTYKKKEIIFHEGDIPQYLYFLNKGKIKVFKTHTDGKEFITNIFNNGEFFGHASLFDNKPYSDSCLALEPSEIYKIPKQDFLELLYKNRDVANQFIKMLSNQIEGQEIQLLKLAYDSVRKRTAEALVKLQKNNPDTKVLVSREDLGKMVGTSTECVIRCLSDLREDKFIEIQGKEITIINRKGLDLI